MQEKGTIEMTKPKRILVAVIYLITTSLILSSCTGAKGLQKLDIVTAVGVDIENEKIIVTCEISNPGSGKPSMDAGSSASKSIFVQGVGNTVFEAIREISLYSDRKLFFSHATVLILGEDLAKKGISGFLDLFLRDYEPRENIYMVVAKDAKAYEIMGIGGELSGSVGKSLFGILNNFKSNGKMINITIAEYFRYYYDISNEPVIGVVMKEEQKEIDEEKKKDTTMKKILNVEGGAALKRDRLIGYFTGDEMIGFNFIVNDIKGGLITFKTPNGLEEGKSVIGTEGKYTTIEILKSKTKNDIKIDKGKIHLNINVKLRGALHEEEKAIDLKNTQVINIIENSCSKEVERLISRTLDKGQKEFENDNFSIGVAVHQQYPKVWREIAIDWDNIFPDITYSVNVETNIVKTGIINVPSNLRRAK